MKNLLKSNAINKTFYYRAIESGLLNENQSVDFAFLRLRGHYSPAAMFFYPSDVAAEYPIYNAASVVTYIQNAKVVVSDTAIVDLTGADTKQIAKVVKLLGYTPLRIPQDSLFARVKGKFYTPSEAVQILDKLISLNASSEVVIFSLANRNTKKVSTGINIVHPLGTSGAKSAFRLLQEESKKLLSPTPIKEALTYETIDYDLLNWRKVVAHPNFTKLRALADCEDMSHLLKFMGVDCPTQDFLDAIAEKVLAQSTKRKQQRQQEYDHEETQPEVTASVPEPKFSTIYQLIKYIAEDERHGEFIDYAATVKRFNGKFHQYAGYKDELSAHISTLKHFSQYCEYGSLLCVKPEDLHIFVTDNQNTEVMTKEGYKNLKQLVKDFSISHATESFREADEGVKFPVGQVKLDGEQTTAVVVEISIAKTLERLRNYLEKATNILQD